MYQVLTECAKKDNFKEGITNGAAWYVGKFNKLIICLLYLFYIYIASGTMQDWNYYFTNDFEVTLELSCGKLLDQNTLPKYWNDNRYSLLAFMGQVNFVYKLNFDLI